jgi:hypothetical protein|tara:strand:- start:1986 stop:2216 length:231 start_codon:yes stop_codon:yes gene_type:complete
MEKLTEEELTTLQTIVTDYNNVKIRIADTFISQDILLKEIDTMKSLYMLEEKKLLEKYGDDTVINVQTGEIKNGNN